MTLKHRHAQLIFMLILALAFLAPLSGDGQPRRSSKNTVEAKLKQFLQQELNDPVDRTDMTTRFSFAVIEPDFRTREEVVVYISGESWCGSGGCTMLVLVPEGNSFNMIDKTTIVQLPIRVLDGRSNGRAELGVWVQGGGLQPGYEATLRFDGKSYPRNPSIAPARRLSSRNAGTVIIGSDKHGDLLF
jgi:hypothetical protein